MAKTSNSRNNSNKQPQQPVQPRHSGESKSTKDGFIQFGNQDADKEHDLTEMNVRPDHYVVRHFSTFTSPSGIEMEDPGSSRIQIYEKEVFDRMYGQTKSTKGQQQESAFEQLGLGVDILHKPE